MLKPSTPYETLTFRLYRLFVTSSARSGSESRQSFGLSMREMRMLYWLSSGRTASPSELASLVGLDRARMSRHLANLSALGYVAREGSSSDGRRAKVVLTAAGQRAYEQLFERITRLNAELLSVLDDAQMSMLDVLLTQLQERADSLAAQHSGNGEDTETVLKELWGLWLGRPAE